MRKGRKRLKKVFRFKFLTHLTQNGGHLSWKDAGGKDDARGAGGQGKQRRRGGRGRFRQDQYEAESW